MENDNKTKLSEKLSQVKAKIDKDEEDRCNKILQAVYRNIYDGLETWIKYGIKMVVVYPTQFSGKDYLEFEKSETVQDIDFKKGCPPYLKDLHMVYNYLKESQGLTVDCRQNNINNFVILKL